MIVDIRYHIFTITAIFAALGLGILVGTSIIGNETLIKEQNKIIREIGVEIQSLKTENRQLEGRLSLLHDELEQRREREQKAFSLLLKDRIEGGKYLLYTDTKRLSADVEEIFTAAGAKLTLAENEDKIKGEYNKVIYWLTEGKREIDVLPDQEAVIYRDNDLLGLIMAVLEHSHNEQ